MGNVIWNGFELGHYSAEKDSRQWGCIREIQSLIGDQSMNDTLEEIWHECRSITCRISLHASALSNQALSDISC